MRNLAKLISLVGGMVALVVTGLAAADVILKASHQFPGGKGDPRDEMVQMIAREAE